MSQQHPPFEGYDDLSAKEVIKRLADASQTEIEAVLVYEADHQNRKTIVNYGKRERKPYQPKGRPPLAKVAEDAAARDTGEEITDTDDRAADEDGAGEEQD